MNKTKLEHNTSLLYSLVPSQPPEALVTIDRTSPRSLNVTWNPVPQEFMHGTLTGYTVTYQRMKVGDITREEEPVKSVPVGPNVTSKLLTDLDPYVQYKVSVSASTAKGEGPKTFAFGGRNFFSLVVGLDTIKI